MNEVYRIIAVEDSDREFALLERGLKSYEKEKGIALNLTRFTSVEDFMTVYRGGSDLIFLDIQLPGMNGMSGAELLRQADRTVALVFVTNLAQYAVNGYAVNALDYIVKPLSVKKLFFVMDKAIEHAKLSSRQKRVTIRTTSSFSSISSNAITFVEVSGHRMTVHMTDGSEITATGSLSALYDELRDYDFERCNSCYLVNMRYIAEMKGDVVHMITGEELLISKRRKREFVDRVMDYITHS